MRENPRPVLLECMTFRMRGHEEASGTKYVPPHLFDEWRQKDPLRNFESFLLNEQVLRKEWLPQMHAEYTSFIEAEVEKAFAEPEIVPDVETELRDMYKSYSFPGVETAATTSTKRYIDAISDALKLSMRK